MTTLEVDVEGMSCQHCVNALTKALSAVPGVSSVDVRVGHAKVETDGSATRDAIVRAVEEEGYHVVGG